MSKRIPLTQGQVAIIDNEDYERLSKHKWCARWDPDTKTYVALRNGPRAEIPRRTIFMSREIMNPPDGKVVDHKDHNTLDSRKSNLRVCSATQNARNRIVNPNTTSGWKGVSCDKRTNKFYARIRVDGSRMYLGSFEDPMQAARAYDKAAAKHHGQFACLNFPECGKS